MTLASCTHNPNLTAIVNVNKCKNKHAILAPTGSKQIKSTTGSTDNGDKHQHVNNRFNGQLRQVSTCQQPVQRPMETSINNSIADDHDKCYNLWIVMGVLSLRKHQSGLFTPYK